MFWQPPPPSLLTLPGYFLYKSQLLFPVEPEYAELPSRAVNLHLPPWVSHDLLSNSSSPTWFHHGCWCCILINPSSKQLPQPVEHYSSRPWHSFGKGHVTAHCCLSALPAPWQCLSTASAASLPSASICCILYNNVLIIVFYTILPCCCIFVSTEITSRCATVYVFNIWTIAHSTIIVIGHNQSP
jgi:hypothetical protein